MNSVHPYHNGDRFMADRRHFVFAFHDTMLECIAQGFTVEIVRGSLRSLLTRMLGSLN
jgi:hypothetical protein